MTVKEKLDELYRIAFPDIENPGSNSMTFMVYLRIMLYSAEKGILDESKDELMKSIDEPIRSMILDTVQMFDSKKNCSIDIDVEKFTAVIDQEIGDGE